MIEEQMNEMAEAFLRWPLPDDVCADDIACQVGAPNRTGTNLLTAHQALAMIRFVCRPELTAMYADVERLSAELAALRAELKANTDSYLDEVHRLATLTEKAEAERDALRAALDWYGEKAKEMGKAALHSDSKRMLSLMHELAVDYGKRAALGER